MALPLDDSALDLYLEALDCVVMENGEQSGEFDLPGLLDFYSGYEPGEADAAGFSELDVTLYSEEDLIRALVLEVKRLRSQISTFNSA